MLNLQVSPDPVVVHLINGESWRSQIVAVDAETVTLGDVSRPDIGRPYVSSGDMTVARSAIKGVDPA